LLISSVPPQDPRGEGLEKEHHGERFNPSRRAVTAVLYALCGLHASSQLVARDEISRQGLTPVCPVVQFTPEERVVGRSLQVSVKITNIGTRNFDHTTVKLDFPTDALAVEKASVFPPMKGDDRALIESSFYWLNINIAAGKTRKFTLWVSEEGQLRKVRESMPY